MIKILNFFDFKLGRIFFGNDNNFIINLYGSYKRFLLKGINKKNSFLSKGYVEYQTDEDGNVISYVAYYKNKNTTPMELTKETEND